MAGFFAFLGTMIVMVTAFLIGLYIIDKWGL